MDGKALSTLATIGLVDYSPEKVAEFGDYRPTRQRGLWTGLKRARRQFYESALIDHKSAFRNITKTHETKCTKTHGKSLQKRINLK